MKRKKTISNIIYHVLVCAFGLVMIYPLVWMVMSSFKDTNTIFTTATSLIPEKFTLQNYVNGWKGFAKVGFGTFFKNSLFISITATIGTVLSSSVVAYGFARCKFPGRKLLFAAMLASMMLPAQVLMIPQYLWYQKLNWVGTNLPLIVPYFFAIQGFFVYLILNFIDGIPKDLDEAATIDGCSKYQIYSRIILPLMKPSIVTTVIIQFYWKWDDYMGPLLYLSRPQSYTVSIAIKLFADSASTTDYGAMFAMSTLSLIPVFLIFLFFNRYLVQGIGTSGLKG